MSENIQRNFILGDSWLYYKIYTGTTTSDIILTKIINPVANKLISENIIDQWFFIRYTDPHHHLRVRFHCTSVTSIAAVINYLYPFLLEMVKDEFIWKIQTDVYKREIERYGANTMELSEKLFFYDSVMTTEVLKLIEEEEEELRWLFSLKAIDFYLNSFDFNNNAKLKLMDYLKTSFSNEFISSKSVKKQLDERYRAERKKIENIIVSTPAKGSENSTMYEILAAHEKNIKEIALKILIFEKEGKLEIQLGDLISSYIHMLMNRLFKSKNRTHEMVCYDFLYRYYKSVVAMERLQEAKK
jgi:thiopeptide-type bacteriocin biosynthesis protein